MATPRQDSARGSESNHASTPPPLFPPLVVESDAVYPLLEDYPAP